MYETNFGFKDRPFTVSPSSACFYQASEHKNVLDELLVSISSLNGITILTGEAGTGKTAICLQLISQLEEQFQIQFVEHCNFPTVRALLQTLLYNLTDCYEKVSEQELRLALSAEVRSSFLAHGQPLLLIVDEAHLLPASFLEELRVLSDISFEGKPALQLMLCGQPELEETLIQPALSSLNQRIGCQVYLDRMTRQESKAYIEYRIQRVAEEEREYFTEDAIKFITHVSDGLPRCLNQICDHSLMLAYLQDSSVVDEAIAREALADLQQLPLHWNDPLPARSPLEELRKSEPAENTGQMNLEEEAADFEIDLSVEDRLNELADANSSEAESVAEADDFDWDSSDLLSLGDDIEAIEIGSSSEESTVCETETSEPESESAMPVLSEVEPFTETANRPSTSPELVPSLEVTDGFVEIVDRYAAIDAGLDPATLPQETHPQTDVMRSALRLQPPQFRASVPPEIGSKQNQANSDHPALPLQPIEDENSESASIAFEESQLKQLEPNVFQALSKEISQDDGSFEELLAAQVYEVCSETRRGLLNALNEIRNYTESLETETSEEEDVTYDMVEPEFEPEFEPPAGTSFRVDRQPEAGTQSSATAHLKGPVLGRYKNLFTRLRRKQEMN